MAVSESKNPWVETLVTIVERKWNKGVGLIVLQDRC